MPPKTAATPQPHMARKIEKVRTLKGIKQGDLAQRIGIAQSTLSAIEQSEQVDEDKLQKIADALEMSVEALKAFNEETVINNIQNVYDNATGHNAYLNTVYNPLDKYIEMVEEYKRLVEENKKLYERLLESERRKN